MNEDEIRRIVREEVQEEAYKVGGIYDHCATTSFNMLRSVLEMLARNTFTAFEHNKRPTPDGGRVSPRPETPKDRRR